MANLVVFNANNGNGIKSTQKEGKGATFSHLGERALEALPSAARRRQLAPCIKFSFSQLFQSVCPEPVLAKRSSFALKWPSKRAFPAPLRVHDRFRMGQPRAATILPATRVAVVRVRHRDQRPAKTPLCFGFPYSMYCPEPVLAKRSFIVQSWLTKAGFVRTRCPLSACIVTDPPTRCIPVWL